MNITHEWLVAQHACPDQLNLFRTTFGDSVEVTRAVLAKHGAAFDLNWLVSRLLSPEQLADYLAKHAPLEADYRAKRAPLEADYHAKCDTLWDDYYAKRAPLTSDYYANCATLWDDYYAKCAPLAADYNAKCALALADTLALP